MAKVKQTEKVLAYMKEFGSITAAQAFNDLSVSQLATRIFELKKSGYEIHSRFVTGKNRYGEPVKYKEYYLGEQ
ncbi:MAG: helix-turn-helix domain-containing protein [Oscillospiraceae bacterium]|nr:helix-turn-helix domain-containing protein [Oscillospiraceae bacterium]